MPEVATDLEVKPFAHSNTKLLETFLRLPRKLYHKNRYQIPDWLPQRRELHHPRKNPSFAHLEVCWFVAYRKGDPVGRITAHINRNTIQPEGEQAGFFGFFECEDDQGAASALFDAASEWLREKGCNVLRGPVSFTPHDEWGMLVEGRFEDAPTVQLPWNPRYYPMLCERADFKPARDLHVYEVTNWQWPNERIQKLAARVREKTGARLRPIRLKGSGWKEDVNVIRRFYHEAWADVWGYVPLTDAEFSHLMSTMHLFLHPDFCKVAEVDGKPVGISITLPDVHQILTHTGGRTAPLLWHLLWRKSQFRFGDIITRCRVAWIGVEEGYRMRGIESLFYEAIFENTIRHGINTAELGAIPEDHTRMHNALARIGGRICKTYRVWDRPIADPKPTAPDEDLF